MLDVGPGSLKLFVKTLKVEAPMGDKRACGSACSLSCTV